MSPKEIAADLRISESTANKYIKLERLRLLSETDEIARRVMEDQLATIAELKPHLIDAARRVIKSRRVRRVVDGKPVEEEVKSIDRDALTATGALMGVMAREARLAGADLEARKASTSATLGIRDVFDKLFSGKAPPIEPHPDEV